MNTLVNAKFSPHSYFCKKAWRRFFSTSFLFLILFVFVTGCGEAVEEDDSVADEFTSRDLSAHAKKIKQPSIEEFFSASNDPNVSASEETGKDSLFTQIGEGLSRVDTLIDQGEYNPTGLDDALNTLDHLLSKTGSISTHTCRTGIKKLEERFIETKAGKLCFTKSVLYSKISEVHYYKGEYHTETDYPGRRIHHENGLVPAKWALSYFPIKVGYLWMESNRGAKVSLFHRQFPSTISKGWNLDDNEEAFMKSSPRLIIRNLRIALSLPGGSKFDNVSLTLAYGRACHTLPFDYGVENYFKDKGAKLATAKASLEDAYKKSLQILRNQKNSLSKANRLHLPKLFLYDFHRDQEGGLYDTDKAHNYAQKVLKVLKSKAYRNKYPVSSRIHYREVKAFYNQ